MKTAIYIHGLNGSTNNIKTKELSKLYNVFISLDYPESSPQEAISFIDSAVKDVIDTGVEIVLIGSSLGGYYADYISKKYNLRAILINPLVIPSKLSLVGCNETFINEVENIQADKTVRPGTLVLLDSGDEIFDISIALYKYKSNAQIISYRGGSHTFEHIVEATEEINVFNEAIF